MYILYKVQNTCCMYQTCRVDVEKDILDAVCGRCFWMLMQAESSLNLVMAESAELLPNR